MCNTLVGWFQPGSLTGTIGSCQEHLFDLDPSWLPMLMLMIMVLMKKSRDRHVNKSDISDEISLAMLGDV